MATKFLTGGYMSNRPRVWHALVYRVHTPDKGKIHSLGGPAWLFIMLLRRCIIWNLRIIPGNFHVIFSGHSWLRVKSRIRGHGPCCPFFGFCYPLGTWSSWTSGVSLNSFLVLPFSVEVSWCFNLVRRKKDIWMGRDDANSRLQAQCPKLFLLFSDNDCNKLVVGMEINITTCDENCRMVWYGAFKTYLIITVFL